MSMLLEFLLYFIPTFVFYILLLYGIWLWENHKKKKKKIHVVYVPEPSSPEFKPSKVYIWDSDSRKWVVNDR